jgi:regulator of cell morphogenesis and NO signaling
MMSERLERTTIGDIVATDFRAAAVFERFGIDFCCGGRRSLVEACRSAANPDEVMRAIDALGAPAASDGDVRAWTVDRLIDHILVTHHTYLREALPAIGRHLAKLQSVHGQRHPELHEIVTVFEDLSDELSQHMIKEEQVLFPYVRDLAEREEQSCGGLLSPFGTVANPIRMMEREHQDAGDAMRTIRELTHGYTAPADGCGTYAVTMAELADFERDLHEHVHLENNVLFPRAIALENESAQ